MADKPSDPGPGAKGDAASGAAATNPANSVDVEALIASAVEKTAAKLTETFGGRIEELETKVTTQAENHQNQIRRLKGKSGGDGDSRDSDSAAKGADPEVVAELEALKEQNRLMQQEMQQTKAEAKATKLDKMLADALAAQTGLVPKAIPHIRDQLRPYLDLNSQGEVIYRDGQKHIPMATKLADVISYDGYQASANRGGGGRPGETFSQGDKQIKTVSASDREAQAKHFDEICAGTVIVVPDD